MVIYLAELVIAYVFHTLIVSEAPQPPSFAADGSANA